MSKFEPDSQITSLASDVMPDLKVAKRNQPKDGIRVSEAGYLDSRQLRDVSKSRTARVGTFVLS